MPKVDARRAHDGHSDALVSELRKVVAANNGPAPIAEAVSDLVRSWPDPAAILTDAQRVPDANELAHHLVHAEPDGSFSLVAIAWLPGQTTPIHDHLCWCVVAVLAGAETELRYRLEPTPQGRLRAEPTERVENRAGSVVAMAPPGDIHKVVNLGDDVAVSLHVYGANLSQVGTSIRQRYHIPNDSSVLEPAHS